MLDTYFNALNKLTLLTLLKKYSQSHSIWFKNAIFASVHLFFAVEIDLTADSMQHSNVLQLWNQIHQEPVDILSLPSKTILSPIISLQGCFHVENTHFSSLPT